MMHAAGELSSSMESLTYESAQSSQQMQQQQQRTKRMRTSFKHHQLRTMKSYFNINQNPDAKDLKQLAQKTGLSKRVLQVSLKQTIPLMSQHETATFFCPVKLFASVR
ncbi:hypothetical protein AAG570_004403 [Ranatra chinensis]|uniref:Homeobox domain-containing protein n=1 Tax=Ranatra chinensis TaxID=642074 RepID=A0ABD0Y292_9HEMI